MNNPALTEKEFEIINVIAAGFQSSQRDLSDHVGLSLGMTNLLLKRLVNKGYLKVRQLNRKKFEYLLSPKGFSEKARKAYNYTLRSIRNFGLIRKNLLLILKKSIKPPIRQILILGQGDLADFVRLVTKDHYAETHKIQPINALPQNGQTQTLVLNVTNKPLAQLDSSLPIIDVIPALHQVPYKENLKNTLQREKI